MSTKTIPIHADELEYTSEGLRTRGPIPLRVGAHNRVEIVRPKVVEGVPLGRGGFPHDSAFPSPAALAPALRELVDRGAQGRYQVYGHAQSDGSEAHNKELSDRRAEVTRALLVADVDAVQAIAEEESWGPREHQVMLRALHCDPGPIDGDIGPLTEAAVGEFQPRYVDGEFHREGDASPRHPALAVDGKLGANTAKALVDAFVNAYSPHLDANELHPTHPAVGCSEFNLLPGEEPDAVANRRTTLVVHESLPRFHDQAPCTQGDHHACPVDDVQPHRCLWYRAHVAELRPPLPRFLDPRWLALGHGKYLLSALTTVPDEEEVEFQVYAATEPVDGKLRDASVLRERMGPPITCVPNRRVAQVVWHSPQAFAPGDDGRIGSDDGQRVVPVFRVVHPPTGVETFDSWPAHEVGVLFDRRATDEPYAAHEATRLELSADDVGFRAEHRAGDALPFDEQHYIIRFEGAPPEGRYSLVVHYGDELSRTLFVDVPYAELDDHGARHVLPQAPAPEVLPAAGSRPAEGVDHRPLDPTEARPDRWLI